ncbi:ABC transporter permease [Glaciibacter superstes]|uniref:ABC transporter permease n=1 Tax=Glaciibacter superstes TaxID=501023 RepID=UPI0005278A4D|nr:ABC transporter permease [Glaciibacter superstes]
MVDQMNPAALEAPPTPRQMRKARAQLKFLDGTASQSQLIRRRYKSNPMAMFGLYLLCLIYFTAIFAGFLAPHSASSTSADHAYQPPQAVHFTLEDGFFIHPTESSTDIETLQRVFVEDPDVKIPLTFFATGDEYQLLGFIPADVHFFGTVDPDQRLYLLGADRAGADLLSLILYGGQISLSLGLIGVAVSLVLGIVIGGISGYFGGLTDTIIQRVIEFIMSIPTLPLWLGLAAAIPPRWGITETYFAITMILSLLGWTGMARVIRGRVLQSRGEDYILAAKLDGASHGRIILRHMMPSFVSHIIASMSLAVPAMILAETSLSFLGLGLRAPAISWGVLLQDSQNLQVVANAPWLLMPALAVVLTVIAFNFVGDGLRDAADPYGK